jgi:hypothetical protein
MLDEIPDEKLTGEDVRDVLCHPSIGYKAVGQMTGTLLLTRDGQLVIPLFLHGWPLKRSYIEEEVLSNFGVDRADFLSALNAILSERPSGQSPSGSSPATP